jgi:hypothetical protein
MEIIQKRITIKLDKEERDNMIDTISLLEEMRSKVSCDDCPFTGACGLVSGDACLLYTLARDLKHINNNCD